jgi:hypothetical protein
VGELLSFVGRTFLVGGLVRRVFVNFTSRTCERAREVEMSCCGFIDEECAGS